MFRLKSSQFFCHSVNFKTSNLALFSLQSRQFSGKSFFSNRNYLFFGGIAFAATVFSPNLLKFINTPKCKLTIFGFLYTLCLVVA